MPGAVDRRITAFIGRHHVLTLATSGPGGAWCSNMFYAYDAERNMLVFTSDEHTNHITHARGNNRVAASIVLESKIVGRLQGIQITGVLRHASGEDDAWAKRAYTRKFPYAALADLNLWILTPESLKFTDNTLGFGKKLYWPAAEE